MFSGGFGTGPQNGIFGSPGGYPRLAGVVLRPFGGQPCKRSGAKHSPPSFSFVVALRAEDPGFVKILGFVGQLRRTRLAVRDWYVIGAFVGWVCDWYVIGALATSKEIGLNNDTWVCKNNANCYVLELCC